MFKKINNLSEFRLFFLFLVIIFTFKSNFLYFSISKYPWFFEWEAMRYLIEVKNKNLSIYEFLKLYEIKNQFQIFTKIFYLLFFKINNDVWLPKFFTIIIQIIPALYLSIIIKNLFVNKLSNKTIFFLLLFFSVIPASLSNLYHFSESHFYFHIFISILSFEAYSKYKKNYIKLFFILLLLFISAALNMEFVALTLYLTFALFFLFKFIETFNKKFFAIFILLGFFSFLYFQSLYFFEVPVINDGSQTVEKKLSRSFYLVFKVFFHQNCLLLGMFLFFVLINIKFIYEKINKDKNKDFIILLLIFFIIFTFSVAFSRVQIYDRYKDFIQLGGLISIYLLNFVLLKNKFLKVLFISISILVITYNTLFFLDKFYERRIVSNEYDSNLNTNINSYVIKKIEITESKLNKYSSRFISQIKLSTDNKILKLNVISNF